MAIDGTEVRVAGAGHVYMAPKGTALPTDLVTPLPAEWVDLGYVTEDGVGFSFGRETTDLNAWQGSKVRVLTTAEPASVNFALMQTNEDVLPVVFGGGAVAESGTGTDKVYTFTPPAEGVNTERSCVIEFNDGDISYRYCMSRVQLEGNVEFTLVRTGALTYPLTFGVLAADPKFTIVSDDPALASTVTP
jgi:hypothetical protein